MTKQIIIIAVIASLIGALVGGALQLVGDNQSALGGTRFPSGLSADSTSPSSGEVRGTTLTITDSASTQEFTQGGGVTTVTPTSASVTLTESQLLDANVITFTASSTQPALTVTFPATSTMSTLLPNAGDYRNWIIENPFTGAATTTTIAAGTGIDLQEPDGQDVVIDIDDYAWVTCFREASTDVVCRIDKSIPAD